MWEIRSKWGLNDCQIDLPARLSFVIQLYQMAGPAYNFQIKSTLFATSSGRQIGEVNLKVILLGLYIMGSHDPNFTDTFLGILTGKLRPHGCATHDFTTEERRWKRVTRETADSHRVGRLSRISHSPFWSRFAKFILGPGPPSNQFTMMAKNRGQKPKRRRGNSQD